jgi:hypothetical protein
MVEAVQVYRVKNPDGSTSDFASQADAVKHEVRVELLTAVAGMPENATAEHEAMVGALISEPARFAKMLNLIADTAAIAADEGRPAVQQGSTDPVTTPAAPAQPVAAPQPRPAPPAGVKRGPSGNRGPGYVTRTVPLHEMGTTNAAFGDGDDE